MFCKYCGKELPQGSFACEICGKYTEPPSSIEMTPEKYEAIIKHYSYNKFRWEPNNLFSKFFGNERNKYTKQEKESLTQLCMLCGYTTTVGTLFHVPDSTLKTWVYKAKRAPIHKRANWVEVISSMEQKRRVKILVDMTSSIDVAAKLSKMPNDAIEKLIKESI